MKSHIDYITDILGEWGLLPLSIENLEGGIVNTNFKILSSQDTYVLRKVSRWRKSNIIQKEFEMLLKLEEDQEFPYQVPFPLITKNNAFLLDDTSAKYWLYRYIPGEVKSKISEADLLEITKLMGRLHLRILYYNQGEYKEELEFHRNSRVGSLEKQLILFEDNPNLRDAIQELLESISTPSFIQNIEEIDFSPVFHIHRDIHHNNILWNEDKIVGILDFEHYASGKYPLLYDLAGFMVNTVLSKFENPQDLIPKIIQEYRTFALDDSQLKFNHLPHMMVLVAVEGFLYYCWLLRNNEAKAKESGLGNRLEFVRTILQLQEDGIFNI